MEENAKNNLENKKHSKGKKKYAIRIIFVVIVVILIIIGAAWIYLDKIKKQEEPEIFSEATLQKIIDVDELSTFEAVYNGIATVMNKDKPEKVDYYVAYDAKVKAGIDFEQVDIKVNHEQKMITVTLPKIKITDINVDITSLDYIFENDK